ncbi:MAG: type IX secretion system sortase PorU [Bacteroidota bacterium]
MSETNKYIVLFSKNVRYNKVLGLIARIKLGLGMPIALLILTLTIPINLSAQDNSVLASGAWHKIATSQSGIYKIDFNFLQNLGLNPSDIDPNKIRIFGNGGKMLPQANNVERPFDLVENAIYVAGAEDNRFDNGDYILFYAQDPDDYWFDASKNSFFYRNNFYSDKSFYFLTIGDENGLRVEDAQNEGNGFVSIDTYDYYTAHEVDQFNRLSSGREWFGERFGTVNNQSIDFPMEGLANNSTIRVISSVMSESLTSSTFNVSLNGVNMGEQSLSAVPDLEYGIKGIQKTDTFSINSSSITGNSNLSVELTYERGDSRSGFLNYLVLMAERDLKLYGNQTSFRSINSTDNSQSTFNIETGSSDVLVWDITSPLIPRNQLFSDQNGQSTFGATTSSLKEFVVFEPSSNLLSPEIMGTVPNQNLKGLSSPNLLIITNELFLNASNRLAELRRSHDGLTVEVVTANQIFNEFSSGSQDVVAMRDFVKFLYDKDEGQLQHLLFIGRSSYDYKDRISNNTNYVPTYESRNSLHPLDTYSSDDFFTFLEDGEGEWAESFLGDHTLDIGVGRFPVKSASEADAVVNKLINYATDDRAFGKWRNEVFFVADDGDFSLHHRQADSLTRFVEQNFPQFNSNKVYLDAFPQVSRPSGEFAPEANERLDEIVDNGALIINYTGHGGEVGWAQEEILDVFMIDRWNNRNNLPLFVTATCEFGRHDDPIRISAGELTILNPNGGAIGLVTTARPVSSSTNFELNLAFYRTVFASEGGEFQRLGDIFKNTKNNSSSGTANRNFSLLGDPSMRLAYPQQRLAIQSLAQTDTLTALSLVELEGEVLSANGDLDTQFSGNVDVTIFDKESEFATFGNENPIFRFDQRDNVIFRGQVSVNQGRFTIRFVVPSNISHRIDNGKISLYATDTDRGVDANGSQDDVLIGGRSAAPTEDNTPPDINVFIEDTSFEINDVVNSNTLLIVRLDDQSGINISNFGIGSELQAVLDDSISFILNDFYAADTDSYQRGWVNFPLNDLTPGKHSITVKARDTHNNASEATVDFVVEDQKNRIIKSISNYPNPVVNTTTIRLENLRVGEDLDIEVEIIKPNGQLASGFQGFFPSSSPTIDLFEWNGQTSSGKKLEPGLYLYRVIVRSRRDGIKNQKFQKLILLN